VSARCSHHLTRRCGWEAAVSSLPKEEAVENLVETEDASPRVFDFID
jgi:hypothetical protein